MAEQAIFTPGDPPPLTAELVLRILGLMPEKERQRLFGKLERRPSLLAGYALLASISTVLNSPTIFGGVDAAFKQSE